MSEPCRKRQGKGYEVRDDEAAADVRVGVGRAVVVHVEQPVVPVLVIVPAEVQTRVGRIEVPVIRRTRKQGTDCVRRHPLYFQAAYAAENPLLVVKLCGLRAAGYAEGDASPSALPHQGSFWRRQPMYAPELDALQ